MQPREVDGHVVDRHRVGEDVARARKDRRAGVEHHRHAALLAFAIDLRQLPQLAAIGIRRKQLMRRMDLDQADAEIEHPPDLGAHVHLVQRIHRAHRHQPIAMPARERRDPVIHLAREAHHVRRDVVDAARAIDSFRVEKAQQTVRRRQHVLRIRVRRVVDHGQHFRLDHLPGLDVDVGVEDLHGRS